MKRFSPTWNPVRLIQRFGRVDRIGTEHDVIHLHNMWPDTAVDADLSLTERLNRRIQTFHDLIGLDSRLLSDAERLNANAMYRIYEGKELPEIDDGLDDVAANQRAIALLQRIQEDDPDLWRTVTSLPDGIRSALAVRDGQAEADNSSYAQKRTCDRGSAGTAHLTRNSGCLSLALRQPNGRRNTGTAQRRWNQQLLPPSAVTSSLGPSVLRSSWPPRNASPKLQRNICRMEPTSGSWRRSKPSERTSSAVLAGPAGPGTHGRAATSHGSSALPPAKPTETQPMRVRSMSYAGYSQRTCRPRWRVR